MEEMDGIVKSSLGNISMDEWKTKYGE